MTSPPVIKTVLHRGPICLLGTYTDDFRDEKPFTGIIVTRNNPNIDMFIGMQADFIIWFICPTKRQLRDSKIAVISAKKGGPFSRQVICLHP